MDKFAFLVGFRKLALALVFLTIAVVFRVLDYIPAKGWIEAVGSVMTAFMATNIGEHVVNAIKGWYETKKRKK